jgi:Glycosyl hydrolases family 16
MAAADDFPANPVEREGYVLEFADEFEGSELDAGKWLPFHLPQWSSRAAAAANYHLNDGCLTLEIAKDQQPWCPEFDGETKVSSLQTGVFSGLAGSAAGQHRFKPGLVVRESQAAQRLYTPRYGYFETRLRAVASPGTAVALWMTGFEDAPERSAEICVCEIAGSGMRPFSASVAYGVKAWGDPTMQSAFFEDEVLIDARDFHVYAVDWAPRWIDFYLDNKQVRTIPLSPAYPMQLMLGIYERPHLTASGRTGIPDPGYPRQFVVDYVRGYQQVDNS